MIEIEGVKIPTKLTEENVLEWFTRREELDALSKAAGLRREGALQAYSAADQAFMTVNNILSQLLNITEVHEEKYPIRMSEMGREIAIISFTQVRSASLSVRTGNPDYSVILTDHNKRPQQWMLRGRFPRETAIEIGKDFAGRGALPSIETPDGIMAAKWGSVWPPEPKAATLANANQGVMGATQLMDALNAVRNAVPGNNVF